MLVYNTKNPVAKRFNSHLPHNYWISYLTEKAGFEPTLINANNRMIAERIIFRVHFREHFTSARPSA